MGWVLGVRVGCGRALAVLRNAAAAGVWVIAGCGRAGGRAGRCHSTGLLEGAGRLQGAAGKGRVAEHHAWRGHAFFEVNQTRL